MEKPRIATVSLCGCFGCHMSLLDLDERFLELAEIVAFERSPIVDRKRFEHRCALGLIEGGCANEENVHVLRDFRESCDVLVSVGDCATTGGVPAMRNVVPLGECLREAYVDAPGVVNPGGAIPNDPEIPLLLSKVFPAHEVVRVDYHLPGCPPPPESLWRTVAALLSGDEVELPYELLKYD
jgi:NAD-reducing hydrogenase small subunit